MTYLSTDSVLSATLQKTLGVSLATQFNDHCVKNPNTINELKAVLCLYEQRTSIVFTAHKEKDLLNANDAKMKLATLKASEHHFSKWDVESGFSPYVQYNGVNYMIAFTRGIVYLKEGKWNPKECAKYILQKMNGSDVSYSLQFYRAFQDIYEDGAGITLEFFLDPHNGTDVWNEISTYFKENKDGFYRDGNADKLTRLDDIGAQKFKKENLDKERQARSRLGDFDKDFVYRESIFTNKSSVVAKFFPAVNYYDDDNVQMLRVGHSKQNHWNALFSNTNYFDIEGDFKDTDVDDIGRFIKRKQQINDTDEITSTSEVKFDPVKPSVLFSDIANDQNWNEIYQFFPQYLAFYNKGYDVHFKMFMKVENSEANGKFFSMRQLEKSLSAFKNGRFNFSLHGRLHNGEIIVSIVHQIREYPEVEGLEFYLEGFVDEASLHDVLVRLKATMLRRMFFGNCARNILLVAGRHSLGFERPKIIKDLIEKDVDYTPKSKVKNIFNTDSLGVFDRFNALNEGLEVKSNVQKGALVLKKKTNNPNNEVKADPEPPSKLVKKPLQSKSEVSEPETKTTTITTTPTKPLIKKSTMPLNAKVPQKSIPVKLKTQLIVPNGVTNYVEKVGCPQIEYEVTNGKVGNAIELVDELSQDSIMWTMISDDEVFLNGRIYKVDPKVIGGCGLYQAYGSRLGVGMTMADINYIKATYAYLGVAEKEIEPGIVGQHMVIPQEEEEESGENDEDLLITKEEIEEKKGDLDEEF